MKKAAILILLTGGVIFAGAPGARAQGNSPGLAQVVALDECDPVTFNAAVGPDFCKNVTLGAFTTLGGWNSRSGLGLRTRQVDDQAGDHPFRGRPRR